MWRILLLLDCLNYLIEVLHSQVLKDKIRWIKKKTPWICFFVFLYFLTYYRSIGFGTHSNDSDLNSGSKKKKLIRTSLVKRQVVSSLLFETCFTLLPYCLLCWIAMDLFLMVIYSLLQVKFGERRGWIPETCKSWWISSNQIAIVISKSVDGAIPSLSLAWLSCLHAP